VEKEPETGEMNARSVKILAIAVVVLFGIMFALNSGDRGQSETGENILFPELKERLNYLNAVTVTNTDGEISLIRESESGRWIVPEKDGYVANTGTLRQLLLALADARKLEQKTSDPKLYDRLGVRDPRDEASGDGAGVVVTARGDDAAVSLILGATAQQDFRYARIPEQPESWLIDQNPMIPVDDSGWLLPDIVDIGSSRVQSVAIQHSDGEVIRIYKQSADEDNFKVEDIPEGRELSYPTVANGIAGVLNNLNLEDVTPRAGSDEEAVATVEFTTFDGLKLSVNVHAEGGDSDNGEDNGEQHWITLQASASTVRGQEEPAEDDPDPDAASRTTEEESTAEHAEDATEEAAGINERVAGWAYRIPKYKIDQLMRRWDDILSEE
jgi:hypothetical protein